MIFARCSSGVSQGKKASRPSRFASSLAIHQPGFDSWSGSMAGWRTATKGVLADSTIGGRVVALEVGGLGQHEVGVADLVDRACTSTTTSRSSFSIAFSVRCGWGMLSSTFWP